MAILSDDKTYVIVERGDTLWGIARDYGNGLSYTQLASINGIPNPSLIYVGQKIKLSGKASSNGSGGDSGSTANIATITAFGYQSNSNGTLFAVWSWDKDNTENYKVEWTYDTGDGVWFSGSTGTVEEKQSTYNIPSNAKYVRFRVKPISKTYTSNGNTASYWTASWSSYKTYDVNDNPLAIPPTPAVSIDKYTLTAELDNLDSSIENVEFQVVKDNLSTPIFSMGTATVETGHVSYACKVDAGGEYKVRCRSCKGTKYSEFSGYSSNVATIPAATSGIIAIKATSETSIYLEWEKVNTAESYAIEYATKITHFDGSDQTTIKSGIETTHYEISGLESGTEYFFRVQAVNTNGESAWSGIESVVVGKTPVAPTTWSSTTTAIIGDPLILYWIHNAEDGSSQTFAELELYIDGRKETRTIKNTTDENEKDKTSSYAIDTTKYVEGAQIQWRVRTAGITKTYGDWSVQRNIDIYAPPVLALSVTDNNGNTVNTLTTFPFTVSALAGPNTQAPISYHLSIASNEIYETIDNVGNIKMVNKGELVYSKHFDISDPLSVKFSASNIDLENNISYTIVCTVSMNSGLTSEASYIFNVHWSDRKWSPNAEISIDKNTLVAYIRPYCEEMRLLFYKVILNNGEYSNTSEHVDISEGVPVEKGASATKVYTKTGEQVFSGKTASGDNVYYCTVNEVSLVPDITLSVYRREFDGTFTELVTGMDNLKNTFITDPHPSLDFARYRVVAITNSTGAVSYYDLPGYPVGEKSIVIQWNEKWSYFDATGEDSLVQPPWSGSLLKLPYNIDIADKYSSDVSAVKYIGRKYPVSYYGTSLGMTPSWKADIDKKDVETLYALRRLAIWMGDVYVREPSGSGYWANVVVSFSQTHCETTIPVTLDITRVEGGM